MPFSSRALIVIEKRALLRHLLASWLATACPKFEMITLSSCYNAEANKSFSHAALVMLGTGSGVYLEPTLEAQVRLIRSMSEDIPIALVGDCDVGKAEEVVGRLNLSGYIPMTSTSEVAAAALRLIMAGGRYLPREKKGIGLPGDAEALTPRERAILRCIRRGHPNKQIARDLGISVGTVKMHVHNIISKLKVRNRTEAAIGLTDPN